MAPKTRTEWWLNKINGNVAKDLLTNEQLTIKGWKVIEIWECQLNRQLKDQTLALLLNDLKVP
ncbi:Very short patch repair protein [compost metagenome]